MWAYCIFSTSKYVIYGKSVRLRLAWMTRLCILFLNREITCKTLDRYPIGSRAHTRRSLGAHERLVEGLAGGVSTLRYSCRLTNEPKSGWLLYSSTVQKRWLLYVVPFIHNKRKRSYFKTPEFFMAEMAQIIQPPRESSRDLIIERDNIFEQS